MSTTTEREISIGYIKGSKGFPQLYAIQQLFSVCNSCPCRTSMHGPKGKHALSQLSRRHDDYRLEISVGSIDFGADISRFSYFPGEKEILMPPLSGLEVRGASRFQLTRMKDNTELILKIWPVRVNGVLSVHLVSPPFVGSSRRRHRVQVRLNVNTKTKTIEEHQVCPSPRVPEETREKRKREEEGSKNFLPPPHFLSLSLSCLNQPALYQAQRQLQLLKAAQDLLNLVEIEVLSFEQSPQFQKRSKTDVIVSTEGNPNFQGSGKSQRRWTIDKYTGSILEAWRGQVSLCPILNLRSGLGAPGHCAPRGRWRSGKNRILRISTTTKCSRRLGRRCWICSETQA